MKTGFQKIAYMGIVLMILLILPSCKKDSGHANAQPATTHSIIPLPYRVDLAEGFFVVDKNIRISGFENFPEAKEALSQTLTEIFGTQNYTQSTHPEQSSISFIPDAATDSLSYKIVVGKGEIKLFASSRISAFYAVQSLRQLIFKNYDDTKKEASILCYTIFDKPLYSWRGFHLDVSRHFFSKEYLLKIIDWLAYYKLNKFHLHFSDDQGWRVELPNYQQLTSIGAWRYFDANDSACMLKAVTDPAYSIDSRFIRTQNEEIKYGGYYTQADITELVNYAASRFVDIVPEFDMPGHMSAAIRAYPFLSCTGLPGWGSEFSIPICPCNSETMDFAKQIWSSVMPLFPAKTYHLGCDEVEKDTWASSPDCQLFMSQNGINSLNGLQNYFLTQMQQHVEQNGHQGVAWDDVTDGNTDKNLLIMYWRDWITDVPRKCAANGNSIILCPWYPFYLSTEYSDKSLKDLYMYTPTKIFDAEINQKIIGLQGCVWTEFIPSEEVFERHTFPRMQALAEVCWSPMRDWGSFTGRMQYHFLYMNKKAIRYSKPAWIK